VIKIFLYFFFTAAFLSLVLTAAYLLVIAGGKYNGEDTSPAAIYNRSRNGIPTPAVVPRKVDSNIQPQTELERINEQNSRLQQVIKVSPSPSPKYVNPYTVPGSSGQ